MSLKDSAQNNSISGSNPEGMPCIPTQDTELLKKRCLNISGELMR